MGKLTLKSQSGFTVVELLVVLIMLAIVSTLGYMFFGFGLRAFSQGEEQSIAQQGIRQAAKVISSEIRYADEIILSDQIITNSDDLLSDPDDYYHIYQQGNSIYFQNKDKNLPVRILLDSSFDNIAYNISFTEEQTSGGETNFNLVVSFTIETENDLYGLTTNVLILNLNSSNRYSQHGDAPYTVIMYTKP